MVRTAALALLLLAYPFSSSAQEEVWTKAGTPYTARWVADVCASDNPRDTIICYSYMRGVSDGSDLTSAINKSAPLTTCEPADVTSEQLRRVVAKYGRDHPERLNLSGAALVFSAILEAWPCKK